MRVIACSVKCANKTRNPERTVKRIVKINHEYMPLEVKQKLCRSISREENSVLHLQAECHCEHAHTQRDPLFVSFPSLSEFLRATSAGRNTVWIKKRQTTTWTTHTYTQLGCLSSSNPSLPTPQLPCTKQVHCCEYIGHVTVKAKHALPPPHQERLPQS